MKGYLRYVDDLFVLAYTKNQLVEYRQKIKKYLMTQGLEVHPTKDIFYPTHLGCDVLGYRVWPERRQMRNDNGFRFRRNLKKLVVKYQHDKMEWSEIHGSVRSWIGHAEHGDTRELRKKHFSEVSFCRG